MENERICCGFGHREVYADIDAKLTEEIEKAVADGVTVFYTGGMGDFDSKFSSCVRAAKRRHDGIRLILVKPYFSDELNKNRDYYAASYDGVLIPDELLGVHYKSAITKRNRWMVDKSDLIIGYVQRDFGGAFDALKYAEKQGKRVVRLL